MPRSRSMLRGVRSVCGSAVPCVMTRCLGRSGTVSSNSAAVGRAEAPAETSAGLAMKRVIAALDEAHARLAEADRQRHEPIAIVGMACRSALGDGADELWQALLAGRDGVRPIPSDRWPDAGPTHCREAAMLADVAGFDAAFF